MKRPDFTLVSVVCHHLSGATAPAGCHKRQLHSALLLPKCGHDQRGGDGDITDEYKGSMEKLLISLPVCWSVELA